MKAKLIACQNKHNFLGDEMTTLAVLADIHGNSVALQVVLDDLDSQGGADHLIVLGDLAFFGPDPMGVLNLLWEREPIFYVWQYRPLPGRRATSHWFREAKLGVTSAG